MKRKEASLLLLLGAIVSSHASVLETATYETEAASSPAGTARLRVTPLDANEYAVDLSVIAPNRTHHTGHVQGLAKGDAHRLTLKIPNFQPNGTLEDHPICTVVIELDERRARVSEARYCAGFAGAAASFFEQGQNLVRVL